MEYICLCGKNFGNAKTAFREHNKNCKNKPTEFICSYCNRAFSKKGTCVFHENNCSENPNCTKSVSHKGSPGPHKSRKIKENGWECPLCKNTFRTRRLLEEHKKQHRAQGDKQHRTMIKVPCNCQFCDREFTTTSSKTLHEKYCKQNPNAIHRVGYKHSEETKQKISLARKKFIENNPDKIPFVMYQHQKQKSYAEQYFLDWLKKENIYDSDEYRVSRYQLDFAWPKKKIYFEVDGNYHKYDFAKKHDKEREENLKKLGWKCIIRIDWSNYKKLLIQEKKTLLENIKKAIENAEQVQDIPICKSKNCSIKQKKEPKLKKVKKVKEAEINRNHLLEEKRWNIIKSCDIDFSKFGWVKELSALFGIAENKAGKYVKKHFPDFYKHCYIKNGAVAQK